MSTERARLKPLPRSVREWAREVDGINRFLANIERWREGYGIKWAERMAEYNRSRLEYLMANKPHERAIRRARLGLDPRPSRRKPR